MSLGAWRSVAATAVAVLATASLASACSGNDANGAVSHPVASRLCAPLADPAVTVEYEAVTTDGHYVVTLMDNATRATTRRVFYGTPGRMVEGTVTDVQNSCARYIYFDVEGPSYAATFSQGDCSRVVPGRFSVDFADGGFVSQGLTLLNPARVLVDGGVAPETFSYLCF